MDRRASRLLPLLLAAPVLAAFDYGTPIVVRTEQDVYELEYAGEIDEDMRNVLLGLLAEPLDPNTASREELQQLPDVTYATADAILAARGERPFGSASDLRAIVGRPIWREIKAFVEVPKPPYRSEGVSGTASARVLEQLEDEKAPAGYVKARFKYQKWLDAGVVVLEESSVRGPDYSGAEPVFDGYGPRVALARAHVAANRGSWSLIAGHYGVGFGQRLTFDETDKERPDGWETDLGSVYEDTESYDSLSVSKHLLGVAATLDQPLSGGNVLRVTVFGSAAPQDLYYTYLDPNEFDVEGVDEDEEADLYPTFPYAFTEGVLGLNTSFYWTKEVHLGATAWGGRTWKRYDYDFSGFEIPNRSVYGAVGLDGAWSNGILDLYGEAAVTDSGGVGSRVEGVWNPATAEITLAMRWYGIGFDNPHSRASSQADELSWWDPDEYQDVADEKTGRRDQDELGPQAKVTWRPADWLGLRWKADVWHRAALDAWNGWTEVRSDVDLLDQVGIDLLGSYTDKDLSGDDEEPAYDCGEDTGCQGRKVGGAVGLRVEPVDPLLFQAWYKEALESDDELDHPWFREHYWWVKATWDITDDYEISARYKDYEDRVGDDPGPTSKYRSVYGQAVAKLPGKVKLTARYEMVRFHEDPDEGPNPEHHLKAGVDVRF